MHHNIPVSTQSRRTRRFVNCCVTYNFGNVLGTEMTKPDVFDFCGNESRHAVESYEPGVGSSSNPRVGSEVRVPPDFVDGTDGEIIALVIEIFERSKSNRILVGNFETECCKQDTCNSANSLKDGRKTQLKWPMPH